MCFTPAISLSIFVIELSLALIVMTMRPQGPKRRVYGLAALILALLGAYQFSQFMFCTSGNFELWARIGFLCYNALPLLSLYFAYSLAGKKLKRPILHYVFLLAFSAIAIGSEKFVRVAECSRYYITIEHYWSEFTVLFYGVYYLSIILYVACFLYFESMRAHGKQRKILLAGVVGTVGFTLPAFILAIVFPAVNIAFPSVSCEFALLFSISVFYIIHLMENK